MTTQEDPMAATRQEDPMKVSKLIDAISHMTAKREQWEIVVGNEAVVTERVTYVGTQLGAVRAAHKRWRARCDREHSLVLCRPGCQPVRVFHSRKAGETL